MMKNKKHSISLAIFYLLFGVAPLVFAQEKENKNNLDFLTYYTSFAIKYDYSDMAVGEFNSDEKYIEYKMTGYTDDEESGKKIWLDAWFGNRAKLYQPSFEKGFNSSLKKTRIALTDSSKSNSHTIIVKTKYIEPGFYVGVMAAPSEVKLSVEIYDNSDLQLPLAQYKFYATASEYEAGARIAKAYGKCGKALGKIFAKRLKKNY